MYYLNMMWASGMCQIHIYSNTPHDHMYVYVNVNLFMLEYISWPKFSQSDRTHPALLLWTTRSTTINLQLRMLCVESMFLNIKLELLGNITMLCVSISLHMAN